ncbi:MULTISPECIES: glucans biosynthesis glucosyltransferase MdoH [unclassified Bosea (in: a-proteobacteria)]|uniref:glucans biosynthesis glucosyltransferase MdoH n=1 Tax=unclassified Bosea (in: a-proteobacteria) TaxID=2653178 RepID=UPI0010263A1C|nr:MULTISPECIES: glucans biosynthesis glucosyltransferase MdoH [unclassified Bosea (in: a-proteobacteria)]RXT26513.1 glucan biosynthesis glucosyltransferase H [Bosea sp. Tri-39]RXT33114.1 glucan biosynthesis glucosyltransferase H [Bosea sp. Tri-54]
MNQRPAPTTFQAAAQEDTRLTPAGLQSFSTLRARRWLVAALNLVTLVALLYGLSRMLSAGGWSLADIAIFIAFLFGAPWTVLGFWNAVIGLWLLHGTKDGLDQVAPFAAASEAQTPLTVRTAVLMTLRNEDPARAFARLRIVKDSVNATGEGGWFDYFVLSDTNDPAVAAREEALAAELSRDAGEDCTVVYRRRSDNAGYKAGNVRDFCERWGDRYELMLPLDADSVMSGDAIVKLARMMQAYPKLGILQSLVVGMPSKSAFARIFQFGMRHGMRPYTMGSAWWIGECGPFWGHNAMVRIAPFRDHCHLPTVPGGPPLGGPIMSHDQVEATLMRRAGYEVRVLPVEAGSWEENPPTMLEFARRDLRWCLGNLQYLKIMDIPGLKAMSRFQLAWAILMFIGLPAWTLMIALLPLKVLEDRAIANYPAGFAAFLYVLFFTMYLSPKLAGFADILLTKGGTLRYGGTLRFVVSSLIEIIFAFLQGAVSTFRTTLFMIGLAFGKAKIGWNGQARDAHALSFATAFAGLWPHLLFGLYIFGTLAVLSPTVLIWSLPLTAGYILAIPFAMLTAAPALGALFVRSGLCGIPEDFDPPAEIVAIQGGDAR